MKEETRKVLLQILDKHEKEIIRNACNRVYNESVDLREKRSKEDTLKLCTELYYSNKDVLVSEDYIWLDKFLEYVVGYGRKMGFRLSTNLRKLLSLRKALEYVLRKEIKDKARLAEIVTRLDELYGHSVHTAADKYQEAITRVLVEKQRRYLEDVLASVPVGLLTHDKEGKITSVNPTFEKMLEREAKDFLGKTVEEVSPPFLAPDALETVRERIEKCTITGEGIISAEIKMLDKNGKEIPVSCSAAGIRDAQGNVVGVVCSAEDITERKKAEEALRESEQKYRTLAQTIPMKVFHKDRNSVYVSCNDLYAKDLRIPATEIAGKTDYEFYPESLAEKYRADDQRIMESGETEQIEEDYIESGEYRTVLTVKTPVRDERGNVTGVLGIFTDITERKRAQERLRVAAESLSDVIYEWDMKDRIDWFGKIDELLGYAPNEFPRTLSAWKELLHPEDRDAVMAAIDRHLKTGAPYDIEYRVKRKDGTWCYWLARGRALRDVQGIPYKWIGAISDITERKWIEEALWESEERYRALIENTLLGITVIDTNYKIITVNPVVAKTYNKPIGDFVGKYCFREFEKREAVCPHCPGARAMASGKTEEAEAQAVIGDGSRIYLRNRATPFFGPDGVMKGFIEVIANIDERKKAEEKLGESEERFRTIFDNAVDGLLLADTADKTFHGANRMMCQMLGYSPEELDKLRIDDIHPQDALPYVIDQFEKQNRGEIAVARDIPVKRKDGTVFYTDVSASHMTLGGKRYLLGIFRDITERKKAEETLRKLEAEKLVVKELKELDRMKNEFVETITHELRTPMTPLRSTLEMFLDGTLGDITPQQKEYVEMMSRNVERLSRFATDILSLSRLDSGAYALRPQEMSVFSVVRPAIELLKKRAEKKNISLSLVVRTEIFAFADPDAVSEVVTNLVNNAIVHCPEGTQVVISSRMVDENFIEVSVADNGLGIPEGMIDKIFDRFFQAKRTRGPGYKGAGVGLTISRALVEKMGGKISVESEPGKGSLFRFTLPVKTIAEP
jgi:PAS domain S-box-containing protein